MLIDSIKMGFNDLGKRKFRTALTTFSIAIGTMLLIVMFGLGEGVQKVYNDNVNSLSSFKTVNVYNREEGKFNKDESGKIISHESGKEKIIDRGTLDKIKAMNGVKSIVAGNDSSLTEVKIDDKTGKKVEILGMDLENTIFTESDINEVKSSKKKPNKDNDNPIIAGKILSKENSSEVLVGQKYLEKMGISDYKSVVGKDIELKVEFPKIEGIETKAPLVIKTKIAGVVNSNYNERSNIIASAELVSKVQEYCLGESDYLNKKGYSKVIVECKSLDDVKTVNDEIKKLGYEVSAQTGGADEMSKVLSVAKLMAAAAGIIVLLVSAIGVINTMTMAVYEKTKSIGIMKAQGASRRHINTMFVVQSGVLGFIGGVVGSILALIASFGLNKFVVAQLSKKGVEEITKLFYTPVWSILAAIGFSVLICLIAGIVPARRAAKLNPVDSLRYE